MAKQALLQRELKRDRLVAKFANKYNELKAIAKDAKRSDEERDAARAAHGCAGPAAAPFAQGWAQAGQGEQTGHE